jgi:5-methylthioribose kinase
VLRTEVADLRHVFMTSAQALLHGDLHSGSVMVGERQGAHVVRVFDPEFSFVGPIGFDLGLYWANALVSEERARALGALTDHGEQLRLSSEAFETELLLGRELVVRRTELTSPDAVRDLVASPLG